MDPRCRVEMMGPLRLVRGDQTLTRFGTQKAAALLAYLALRAGPQAREQVIDAFWPDMDLPAGRNNLSTTLSALRHILEPGGVRKGTVLITSHAHVGLAPAAVTTDVADFERLLAQAGRAGTPQERVGILGQALALYAGDFQPGNYQEWAVRESGRLSARRVEALDRLTSDLEAMGRFAEAAGTARQRLDADPYEETAYVVLIRSLTRAGQTGAAREVAAQFESFFREEFGAPPSPASRMTVAEYLPETATTPGVSCRTAALRPSASSTETRPPEPDVPASTPVHTKATGPASPALPFWLSRFFGREDEMAHLVGLLLSRKDTPVGPDLPPHPCRLVTLLGPGGAGKTRLAAEFARLASERHGLFCVFAPLADLSDPAQIPAQIAQALRLPSNPARSPLDQVVDFLSSRDRPGMSPALLVVDNLEHLLEAAGEPSVAGIVQTLLRNAPGLTVLTTSRRRLGLQGERLLPVNPLPTPDATDGSKGPDGLANMLSVPSVRLYLDRAQAVRPDFGLTAVNAPAVAALCRALEGSPLALELAASWVRLLPPRKMWERLMQGMEMPAGRDADLPDRHKSLTAALDWSWRLLTERQRRLLSRLSVFRGGWTTEAAEVVCDEPNVLGLLADLQEASLVTVTEGNDGEARYGLLETVRQDTIRRLRAENQEADVRGRHLAWFLALAKAAESGLTGPEQAAWLARLETEHDNLRAALDWSASVPEEAESGLRLSTAVSRFWTVRGHMTEGRRRLEAALDRAAKASSSLRANALHALGALAHAQGDNTAAERHLEDCLIIRRESGEAAACADPLRLLAMAARQRGDYAAAQTLLTESMALARAAGNELDAIGATVGLGHIAMLTGDLRGAQDLYAQSLPFYRAVGDRRGWAGALGNLGNVESIQGNYIGAQGLLAECLALYREIGDLRGCAITRHSQSTNAFKLGDLETAIALLRECIALYRDLGDQWNTIEPLESLSFYLAQKGQWERAAWLRSAAETMRQKREIRRTPSRQEKFTEEICAMRQTLGESAFQTAWAAGQTMSWEQATEHALHPGE